MKGKFKRRRGLTLVELLGVMVVLVVLVGIAAGGIVSARNRASITSAESTIRAYADAFLSATTQHPGVVADRAAAWGTDGTSYTSERGLQKIVAYMNQFLDGTLTFVWDPVQKCYVSLGEDPWGGHYILTEHPKIPGGLNYYDPTVAGNESVMSLSIWATGNNDDVLVDHEVAEDSYGVCLVFTNGVVTDELQGFGGANKYTQATIDFK